MHLIPEPLFTLPTDATYMMSIAGSNRTGRIFLGGKDGCLYEFSYKADNGWFGKKAQKINHSNSTLSFLVPAFINSALYEEDPIEQVMHLKAILSRFLCLYQVSKSQTIYLNIKCC